MSTCLNLANKFFARMGLSIHYSGAISHYSMVDELVDEIEDICKDLNWEYRIWERNKASDENVEKHKVSPLNYELDNLKGISISPKGSETLFRTFLPNRSLCSPVKLIYNDPVTNDLMIEV